MGGSPKLFLVAVQPASVCPSEVQLCGSVFIVSSYPLKFDDLDILAAD